jgi:hypothetical protein
MTVNGSQVPATADARSQGNILVKACVPEPLWVSKYLIGSVVNQKANVPLELFSSFLALAVVFWISGFRCPSAGSCTVLRYKVIQIAAQHVQDGMSWVNGGPNRLRTDNGSSQTTGADAGLDPRPRDKISRKIESPLTLRDTSAVLENSLWARATFPPIHGLGSTPTAARMTNIAWTWDWISVMEESPGKATMMSVL